MVFHKGNGGTVSLAGATTLSVTKWTMTKKARLAETTNSGSSANATWLACVAEADFTADFVFDSTVLVDTDLTADIGVSVAVVLTMGDSGKTYSFTGVIEAITINNDQLSDVVRGTITGKSSGAVTDPTT